MGRVSLLQFIELLLTNIISFELLQVVCDPEEINNTSCIIRSLTKLIKIIFSLVLLSVVISYLGSNMVLASTIRVTQQQAELIEWCTKEMVRVTDASTIQALNVCAEYYLKAG
jgi:hypothetical protein